MDIKARLLETRIGEETVDIGGVGKIRVRALTRAEVMRIQGIKKIDVRERHMLALAVIEPSLTEEEIGTWYRNSPSGEIELVARRIAHLSGLEVDAPKRAYERFETDEGAEFRTLSGDPVGRDDDSGNASTDEQPRIH